MEFYEQFQQTDSMETIKLPEGANSNANSDPSSINAKTEESFNKLENEIGKAYSMVEQQTKSWGLSIGGFWKKNISDNINLDETKQIISSNLTSLEEAKTKIVGNLSNLQSNLPNFEETKTSLEVNLKNIESKISNLKFGSDSKDGDSNDKGQMFDLLTSKTNNYLDNLDKELENVETIAGQYASKFGSFLANVIAIDDDSVLTKRNIDEDDLLDGDADILFNVPENIKSQVYATRSEAQLHTLHTSVDLYLTETPDSNFNKFKEGFSIDSQTEKISSLLNKYIPLKHLMAKIVPTRISYDEFWYRYFYMTDKIVKEEKNRKKLLENDGENEEEFNWDDDEEENINKDNKPSRTSSELTYNLKSADSSTLDIVASKRVSKTDEEVDEDNDDDWE